ncbi:hypothetical protein FB446DRAFT_789603 [Lentinula raphanica]|nr:hypothetical protein FB446DRAFT_789603 [Lentinula raphanica]
MPSRNPPSRPNLIATYADGSMTASAFCSTKKDNLIYGQYVAKYFINLTEPMKRAPSATHVTYNNVTMTSARSGISSGSVHRQRAKAGTQSRQSAQGIYTFAAYGAEQHHRS